MSATAFDRVLALVRAGAQVDVVCSRDVWDRLRPHVPLVSSGERRFVSVPDGITVTVDDMLSRGSACVKLRGSAIDAWWARRLAERGAA